MDANSVFYISFIDAIKDTAGIIPFLFLIFFIIEIVEHFYSHKIISFVKMSKNGIFPCYAAFLGSAFGAVFAAIPQCGFSVIASTLYCKRIITKGMLIAIYIATSDEALPVLISNPKGYKIILPLLSIKILAGIITGCFIDIFFPSKSSNNAALEDIKLEKGCHSHNIAPSDKKETIKELVLHPVIHTLSVLFFVFLITFFINLIFAYFTLNPLSLANFALLQNKFLQPVVAAFFGIIPNCAVSVGLTIMYLKGAISFASCVSGLCAGAGLGILVLIRKNENKKDTLNIIFILLAASILTGIITAFFN